MFESARWLRLVKRVLITIDGQDYTEETWVGNGPKDVAVTERIPRQREWYGKRN